MKKTFLLLTLTFTFHLLTVSATTTSVWTGPYTFPENDGWQEIAPEAFASMVLGDYIQVTVSEITNPDGWAQINLASKDPWMSIPGADWQYVEVGTTKYVVNDETLLNGIKTSGLAIQGKYYTLTDVSIVTGGDEPTPPGPQPEGLTEVWKGEFTFADDGLSNFSDITGNKFANLKQCDYLQVTVSAITNPDGWWQINLAAKDPWTSVPGTNWETFSTTGDVRFQVNDADLVANIQRGGLAVQGKGMTVTSIAILSTTTKLNTLTETPNMVRKYFLNGNLIIERNGIKYTLAGQKVK